MRKIKKSVSILLTIMLLLAMSVTAFAATTYTIAINNNKSGHTYEAYQIFTGDLKVEGGTKILSNIKWGSGQTGHTVGTDATSVAETLTEANIQDFIDELTLSETPTASTNILADGKYVISGLVPGYYLVKDKEGSLAGADDAYTDFILEVVGNAEANPKSAQPTVDKKVKDETVDAEAGASEGWGETADHAINESFQFKLIANIPYDTDLDAYKTYKLVFHDTMSAGVTFESIASVKIQDTPITDYTCTATAGHAGGSWTLTIENLKSYGVEIKGATVEVIYNAHLNENAQIGDVNEDNNNKVELEYSNNPNADGTGKTSPDTVWVFTYEMDNKKVDGSNNNAPLGGAGFKLYDNTGAEIGLIYDSTVEAYRPIKSGETAQEMISAQGTGIFNIKGLDAGTYILKETTIPEGYNACADITVVISAAHSETADGATSQITMTKDGIEATGIEIVNKKGSSLPSTGGRGTTILYVVGTILVLGSAILLITKRRMSKSN